MLRLEAEVSSTDTKLPFGLKGEKIVHVSEVERGLACGCVCPSCGAPLVARKGSKVIHHFAHHNAPECSTALETALHLLAKDILAEEKRLMLPPLVVDIEGFQCEVLPAKSFEFDSVELEYRMEGMIPDVVLHKGKHKLLVEIAVTHFVDEAKKRKIEEAGISAIEIDLCDVLQGVPSRGIVHEQVVSDMLNKNWIFNAKRDSLVSQFISSGRLEDTKREQQEFMEACKPDWIRKKEERERFYTKNFKVLGKMQLTASDGKDFEVFAVSRCPVMLYFNQARTHAFVKCHCSSCKYCRGERTSDTGADVIVCLAPYYLKTRGYLEKQFFIRD